jgi:hypothetical protein
MKRMIAPGGLLLVVMICSSWGFLIHRTINQLAIYELPEPMRYYFHDHMQYIVKYSVRPDQRRNEDPQEAPKHFIDLELFGDSAAWKMPLKWEEAVRRYGKDSLVHGGYVPYYIMTVKDRLTAAFKSGQRDSILFYATDLAHYIGDAHVPLHVTVNYDGQLTGQKGLHSLWETMIPEIELDKYDLRSKHKARYLKQPERAVWKAIRQSWVLLPDVLKQEKEVSKSFTDSTKYRVQLRNGKEYRSYTSAFAKAYSARLGKTINKQLIRSADLIADFWYTCWVDAGRPALATVRKKESSLQNEQQAFKHNKLIKEKLLIARQGKDKEE